MTVLVGHHIPRSIIEPFCERSKAYGLTYGLGPAGYDVRMGQSFWLDASDFRLASTLERFEMPANLLGIVQDKSTWARRGISLFNTVIEPGWRGHLTLEIANLSSEPIEFISGMPIAQILFHKLSGSADSYDGKYQDQPAQPVGPIYES